MSKKHPERSQRRRQARAERRRVEVKRRKSAERARRLGEPRKPGAAAEPRSVAAAGRSVEPPPPERVVQTFHGALDEVLAGGGQVTYEVLAWRPATDAAVESEILMEVWLFGQRADVHGFVDPPEPWWFDRMDEVDRGAAEAVLEALRHDPVCTAAAVLWCVLEDLLGDDLRCEEPQIEAVLRRFHLPTELEAVFDAVARKLPEEVRRSWFAAQEEEEDGRRYASLCDRVLRALEWDISGPLADFGEWISRASHGGWAPPWTAAEPRGLSR